MEPRRTRRKRNGRRGDGRRPAGPPPAAGGGAADPADGRGRRWVTALLWALVGAFGLLAAAVVLVPLPRPRVPVGSVIYDDRDRPVVTLSTQYRAPVSLDRVPQDLQRAIVAAEDAEFWYHHGINPAAILRALWADIRARRVVEGGSTITQQLAKNLFLTPSRTLGRKVLELVYTFKLEATHSKAQILEMYLNTIYLGAGAYGVEAAAETYFGKHVWELDLAQSALLAGLPRAPELYNPFRSPDAAVRRRNEVLERMVAVGALSPARARQAEAEPLRLAAPGQGPLAAGAFMDYAVRSLSGVLPDLPRDLYRGGYRIYTTLDADMQRAAENAVSTALPPGTPDARGIPQPQVALVAIDPRDGAVRAMVGGRGDASFNRALDAHRQPGSAFKPFLYAAVLDSGYTVVDRQFDGPVEFPGTDGTVYRPTDYGPQPYLMRDVTVREAVAISDNVVAVKWADVVGPQRVIQYARRMGIESPLYPTLPIALGTYEVTPFEMARAYAPFANLGYRVTPWAVRRVEDAAGHVLYSAGPPARQRVLDPGVAYLVTSLLESVMTDGTGKDLLPVVGRPVAGKTGTTNEMRDAWFVGYAPSLVAAVWVGDDQPRPLSGYGGTLAGPVWARFMRDALASAPPEDWSMPGDVTTVTVSAVDGLLPNPTSPTVQEVFLRGTEPTQVSPIYGPAPGTPGAGQGAAAGTPGAAGAEGPPTAPGAGPGPAGRPGAAAPAGEGTPQAPGQAPSGSPQGTPGASASGAPNPAPRPAPGAPGAGRGALPPPPPTGAGASAPATPAAAP